MQPHKLLSHLLHGWPVAAWSWSGWTWQRSVEHCCILRNLFHWWQWCIWSWEGGQDTQARTTSSVPSRAAEYNELSGSGLARETGGRRPVHFTVSCGYSWVGSHLLQADLWFAIRELHSGMLRGPARFYKWFSVGRHCHQRADPPTFKVALRPAPSFQDIFVVCFDLLIFAANRHLIKYFMQKGITHSLSRLLHSSRSLRRLETFGMHPL